MTDLLWKVRRRLIAWLAGGNPVVLNAHMANGTITLDQQSKALISGCTLPKPSVRQILAARLREARENMGISDAELAVAAGLPLSTVIEIECGERDTKAWELSKLATALHVDMFDLLREKPIDKPVVLWCGKRAPEEEK